MGKVVRAECSCSSCVIQISGRHWSGGNSPATELK